MLHCKECSAGHAPKIRSEARVEVSQKGRPGESHLREDLVRAAVSVSETGSVHRCGEVRLASTPVLSPAQYPTCQSQPSPPSILLRTRITTTLAASRTIPSLASECTQWPLHHARISCRPQTLTPPSPRAISSCWTPSPPCPRPSRTTHNSLPPPRRPGRSRHSTLFDGLPSTPWSSLPV